MIAKIAFFLLCCLSSLSVFAGQTADDFVRNTSDLLIDAIEASRETFDASPRTLYSKVDEILVRRIDHASIARGVMGKHGKAAHPEQVSRFAKVIRATVVELFSKAMIALHAKSIDVLPTEALSPTRAKVAMNVITAEDETFQLSFSLAQTDGAWRVRNIVISGINLGLTYRSQFDALMREHGGDIDAAIENWRKTLEVTTLEASG